MMCNDKNYKEIYKVFVGPTDEGGPDEWTLETGLKGS